MKKYICIILCIITLLQGAVLSGCSKKKEKYENIYFDFFDTVTTVIGYETKKEAFDKNCLKIKEKLDYYHKQFNIYSRYDNINNLNTVNNSHKPVTVDSCILDMLEFCKGMYSLTKGKVNVAMGSVLSIWHDYRTEGISNPVNAKLPPMNSLKKAYKHTNIDDIVIDRKNSTVFLSDTEMKLDVGAIAKGYATEQVAVWMKNQGITGYLLNVGGNIRAVGSRPDGEKWRAGIENPDTSNEDKPYIEYLELEDMSLVVSGSYQRFYTVNAKAYHHIIDPETLMPAKGFSSVSVVCESSAMADALSTALFTMEYEKGIELVESIPKTYAMWVMDAGKQLYSKGFENYISEELK